jgi:hypothetical protein
VWQSRKALEALRSRRSLYQQKQIDERRTCRENIRRANRDTLFAARLECYRKDLAIRKDLADIERNVLEALPGVPDSVRLEGIARQDTLIDAFEAVIDAIGAGVYRSEEEVLETKAKLLNQYERPARQLQMLSRLMRLHTWTSHLLLRLRSIPADADGALKEIQICLEDIEQAIKTAPQIPSPLDLEQIRGAFAVCTGTLEQI